MKVDKEDLDGVIAEDSEFDPLNDEVDEIDDNVYSEYVDKYGDEKFEKFSGRKLGKKLSTKKPERSKKEKEAIRELTG